MRHYVLSTLVTGVFLAAILAYLTRARDWEQYSLAGVATGASAVWTGEDEAGGHETVVGRTARSPRAWMAAFLLATLGLVAGAIAYVGGASGTAALAENAGLLLTVGVGVLLATYVFAGTYHSIRNRGRPSAEAAMVAFWVLGMLALAAIATRLVVLA